MKKKSQNKNKSNIFKQSYLLWTLALVLIVAQLVSFVVIDNLRTSISKNYDRDFANYINASEQKRYKDAVISISDQKVYIPEARIYVPLNDDSINLKYEYITIGETVRLSLSSANAVGSQTAEHSPTCDKMVWLVKDKEGVSDPDYTLLTEISPTKDGFKYLYLHKADNCGTYYNDLSSKVGTIARGIQSY